MLGDRQRRLTDAVTDYLSQDPHNAEFWSALGGEVAITAQGQDDEAAEAEAAGQVSLK